ncbi:MAG: four helix bundle protein [Candidatus Kapabacteria bacterium]|nr:four helix bundle protein [Candidatus Kapabacteria bacterium]
MSIVKDIYQLTAQLPKEENYGPTSQLCRTAVSIPANIVEGWGRRSTAAFIQFLRQANGSRTERETLLLISEQVGLLPAEATSSALLDTLQHLGRQLTSLERSLQRRKNSP